MTHKAETVAGAVENEPVAKRAREDADTARTVARPRRIQLSRAKGWRMPPNTINVARPSRWGNPFTVANTGRVPAVLRYACEVAPLLDVTPLRSKNLACWCRLDEECHADVLLELANA